MHLKKILLVFLLGCFADATAQDASSSTEAARINNVVPPSPTAAALGSYGNYPAKGFDGVPPIEVPLVDLQLKAFHLPISLSYNAGGVKVGDIGSWVGLGWSLNFGGVITRSVVDEADDFDYTNSVGFLKYNYDHPGYSPHTEDNLNCHNGFRTGDYAFDFAGINNTWMAFTIADIKQSRMDTEPDIFYYNFNGKVGKFVFNSGNYPDGRQILLTPYQDLKIEYILAPNGTIDNSGTTTNGYNISGSLSGFIVTDESGNKYYFQTQEKTFTINSGEGFGYNSPYLHGAISYFTTGKKFISSWYITKIVTALNETINFNYADETYTYEYVPNWSFKASPLPDPEQDIDIQGNNIRPGDFGDYEFDNNDYTIYGKRLTSIDGDNFRVDFISNHARLDIDGSNALTAIKYYSKTDGNLNLLKEFDLTYHYMSDLSKPKIIAGFNNAGDSRLHFLLESIQNKDNQSQNISSFQFKYFGEENVPGDAILPLPDRLSYLTDFWGFFANNNAKNPTPKIYIYSDEISVFPKINTTPFLILPGANKNTNPVSVLSGTLKKITFPTGGSTDFIFEPHVFNYENQNIVGGGLRLKKSIAYDGINHNNDIVKSYSYLNSQDATKTSGVLFNLPAFAHIEHFPYPRGGFENFNDYFESYVDGNTFYKYDLVRSDVQKTTLGALDGITVGYREITEVNNDNSQTIRRFSVPAAYNESSDIPPTQLDEDGDPMGSCDVNFSGFCDGLFQPTTTKILDYYAINGPQAVDPNASCPLTLRDWGANTTGLYLSPTYPYAPNTNYDWNRGILLSEKYLDNIGQLKRSVNYDYILFTPNNSGPQYVKGLRYTTLSSDNYYYKIGNEVAMQVISQYKIITQVKKMPSAETVTDYDASGNALTTTKRYSYSFHSLNPSVEQDDRSDGTSIVTNHKYINDFDFSQSSTLPDYLGYQNLQNSHINALVEDYVQKKNTDNSLTTIGATQVTYKPTLPVPSMSYVMRSIQPISNFAPINISSSAITKDNHYQIEESIDQFDSQGNVLQATDKGLSTKSYKWGYNQQFIVAEIENATNAEFYAENFEENSGAVIGTAHTGNKYYSGSSYTVNWATPDNKSYMISYWYLLNGTWKYSGLQPYTNNTITLSNGTGYDDIRIYPTDAQMTTYTYQPLVGMTSMIETKGQTTYYEYDTFQRLMNIKDKDGNILKHMDYHYKGQ